VRKHNRIISSPFHHCGVIAVRGGLVCLVFVVGCVGLAEAAGVFELASPGQGGGTIRWAEPCQAGPGPNQDNLAPVSVSSVLDDVQDRIHTIDQAGLYELLAQLRQHPHSPTAETALTPDPLAVLRHPQQYRGRLLRMPMILHAEFSAVQLRCTGPTVNAIYYVVGQIPFAGNRRMPAIVLLCQEPSRWPIEQTTVTGYFYMVLRAQTRSAVGSSAPAELDYLVLLASQLPQANRRADDFEQPSRTAAGISLAVTAVLFVVWMFLRRRVSKA